MEPIFSEQTHLWSGLAIAAVFIALRSIERVLFKQTQGSDGDPAQGERGPIFNGIDIFLLDAVFALSYLIFGLQTALVCRLVIGFWAFLRKLMAGYEKAPALLLYMAATKIALSYIIIEGSVGGLHLYGLVVFTFWYKLVFKAGRSKCAQDEGGGSLADIRVFCAMAITYLLFIGLSEFLWVFGGVDYWIWFFVFVKLLAIVGGLLSMLFLLPFLKVFMRAVRTTGGPLG